MEHVQQIILDIGRYLRIILKQNTQKQIQPKSFMTKATGVVYLMIVMNFQDPKQDMF
jgi:hypothetical protein